MALCSLTKCYHCLLSREGVTPPISNEKPIQPVFNRNQCHSKLPENFQRNSTEPLTDLTSALPLVHTWDISHSKISDVSPVWYIYMPVCCPSLVRFDWWRSSQVKQWYRIRFGKECNKTSIQTQFGFKSDKLVNEKVHLQHYCTVPSMKSSKFVNSFANLRRKMGRTESVALLDSACREELRVSIVIELCAWRN